MRMRSGWSWVAALTVMMVALFQPGCEVTSDEDDMMIDPSSSTIVLGQSITLRAEGADDFFWRVENTDWGTLSSTRGDTVVYTSRFAPAAGATVVQKVTVVGSKAESISNSTAKIAQAFITHVSGSLAVSPKAATLRQGEVATFTASGGGSLTWTLETPAYGILSQSTGNRVSYTSQYADPAGKAVVQKITVTSDNGGSAVVLVTQQPGSILSVTPVTTTLSNGLDQLFTIYGGSEYTIAVSQPSWGTISIVSENTFRYISKRVTPPGATEIVTITVTDISSAKATATVYNVP
jgi:hypothetical protein